MISRLTLGRVLGLLWLSVLVLAGCTLKDGASSQTPGSPSAGDPSSDASEADASALEAMHVIEEGVSELRGLDTRQAVPKAFMSTEELRQYIEDEYSEDYSHREARDDVLFYVAFDMMEPGVDLYELLIDVQTEQVLGFYHPDTEEMYVVQSDDAAGALERYIFSHEYVHVLQDQHFDLQELGFTNEDDEDEEDGERQVAIRSLVEGDAYLTQQQYLLQHFDFDDLQEVIGQLEAMDTSVLDSAPAVVQESFLFPPVAGLAFVSALYNDGGWSAVDAAYKDPPLSTEQILHPERYPDDVPQVVTLPPLTDTLGAGWRLVDEDVLGEFFLQLYLNGHLGASKVEDAAEGWGGGRYLVHWREDESASVLALRLAWDTPADATEFFDAYVQFAESRFGGGPARSEGDARLWWFGDDALLLAQNDQDETLILIAPNEATLDALYALFPEF